MLHSLIAIGPFGFASVCLIHTALIALMGLAWWALLPGTKPWVAVWGRFVRDAGSEVLPLSQVGGYVLGTRALALAGVPATRGAASTIVDVTLEFVGQLAYIALGLVWLLHLHTERHRAGVGRARARRRQRAGGRVCRRAAARRALCRPDRGHPRPRLGRAHRRRARRRCTTRSRRSIAGAAGCGRASCCTSCAGSLSASEVWVALAFAGQPIPFGSALVIESLVYAMRTAAFVVPNAVGVQEGAYILLGGAFGLSPEMALALSLLKRARDLTIGLPVLAWWQVAEGGRLSRRLSAKRATPPLSTHD